MKKTFVLISVVCLLSIFRLCATFGAPDGLCPRPQWSHGERDKLEKTNAPDIDAAQFYHPWGPKDPKEARNLHEAVKKMYEKERKKKSQRKTD